MLRDQINNFKLLLHLFKRVPALKHRCRQNVTNQALIRLNEYKVARTKVVQMAVGIEAFLRAGLDLREVDDELVVDFATLVVAYDFLLDELKVEPARLTMIIDHPESAANGKEEILQGAINEFRIKRPQLWSRISHICKQIHMGSVELFKSNLSVDGIRIATRIKGGFSYVAMAHLGRSEVTDDEESWCMDFGYAMQLADDVYDRKEDEALGLRTLPLVGAMDENEVNHLRTPFFKGKESTFELNRLYQFGFLDYLRGAAAFSKEPSLYGRWKHSLGQSLVESLAA